MFSKITQPTLKNFPSNYSPYNAKSVIHPYVGIVKNPCRSKVMFFLINAYCFCSHGKGDSRWEAVLQNVLEPSTLHNEYSTISCE